MPPEFLLIFAVIIGLMFFSSRRNRKQQQQQAEFRDSLAVGDEVMTHGGMFGTVVALDGDVVTLASPTGAETIWLRAAIAKQSEPPYAVEDDDEDYDGEDYEDDEDYDEDDVAEDEADDVDPAEDETPGTPGLIDPGQRPDGPRRRWGRGRPDQSA